jgi:hypothetical protein
MLEWRLKKHIREHQPRTSATASAPASARSSKEPRVGRGKAPVSPTAEPRAVLTVRKPTRREAEGEELANEDSEPEVALTETASAQASEEGMDWFSFLSAVGSTEQFV